jgi:hypothetical protein
VKRDTPLGVRGSAEDGKRQAEHEKRVHGGSLIICVKAGESY